MASQLVAAPIWICAKYSFYLGSQKASPPLSSTFFDGDARPYRASVPGCDGRSPKRFSLKKFSEKTNGRVTGWRSRFSGGGKKCGSCLCSGPFSQNNGTKLEWTHFNRPDMGAVTDTKNPPINLQFTRPYFLVAIALCG